MEKIKIIEDLGISETKSGHKKRFVLAKCPCGTIFRCAKNGIQSKNTKSCGCMFFKPRPLKSYPQYSLLQDMKKRCGNPNQKYYYLYGGRGIKVCKEWLENPMSFIKWAQKNGYKKGLYIDRINPNGNYTPINCRFVNATINALNTRTLGKNNKSGYRGVSKHKKVSGKVVWRTRITVNKKIINLGLFENKIEAAKIFDAYVKENNLHHPLNFTQ